MGEVKVIVKDDDGIIVKRFTVQLKIKGPPQKALASNVRTKKRIEFIAKNSILCYNAFLGWNMKIVSHEDWKSKHGRQLIEKARKKIGYSVTTANCDIYWTLFGLYKWMLKLELIK